MDRSTVKRDKRAQTCCFTGHRKIPHEQFAHIQKQLKETIQELIQKGVIYYGAGGALGFDTLAARTVLKMKEDYPSKEVQDELPALSRK